MRTNKYPSQPVILLLYFYVIVYNIHVIYYLLFIIYSSCDKAYITRVYELTESVILKKIIDNYDVKQYKSYARDLLVHTYIKHIHTYICAYIHIIIKI